MKPIAKDFFPKTTIICSRYFLLWLFINYYNYYLFVHVMYQNMQLIAQYVYLWWLSFVFIKGFLIERSVMKNKVLICPSTVTAFIVPYLDCAYVIRYLKREHYSLPLTLRLLMSYIYIYIYIYIYVYGAHILDVSRSHTTTHHSR